MIRKDIIETMEKDSMMRKGVIEIRERDFMITKVAIDNRVNNFMTSKVIYVRENIWRYGRVLPHIIKGLKPSS